MPVYLASYETKDGAKERLVEANDSRVARSFVAKEIIEVKLAAQADLFRVAKAGGDIEVAKETPAEAPSGEDGGGQGEE